MDTTINRKSYNKIAEQWVNYGKKNAFVIQPIIEFVNKLPPKAKVLDIGCGTGYPIAQYLANRSFQVTGIDFSEHLLAQATQLHLPNAAFFHCDFFDYQPSQKFDGIIAFDSFFHFPKHKQVEIYQRVSDWMQDGGYLLFTHGREEGEIYGQMFGETFYYSSLSLVELKQVLHKADLEIEVLIENYIEKNNQRDLIVVARKLMNTV